MQAQGSLWFDLFRAPYAEERFASEYVAVTLMKHNQTRFRQHEGNVGDHLIVVLLRYPSRHYARPHITLSAYTAAIVRDSSGRPLELQIGGVKGNQWCYNLRLSPGPKPRFRLVLDERKSEFDVAIDLEECIRATTSGEGCLGPELVLPLYYVRFYIKSPPPASVENGLTSALQDEILKLVRSPRQRLDESGLEILEEVPYLPSYCSPGGKITGLARDEQATIIEFDNRRRVELSSHTKLSPLVKEGAELAAGVPLGTPLQPEPYPTWEKLLSRLGTAQVQKLVDEFLFCTDQPEGSQLVRRRLEYCKMAELPPGVTFVEDVAHLMDQNDEAAVQVISISQAQIHGPVTGIDDCCVDLLSLKPQWQELLDSPPPTRQRKPERKSPSAMVSIRPLTASVESSLTSEG